MKSARLYGRPFPTPLIVLVLLLARMISIRSAPFGGGEMTGVEGYRYKLWLPTDYVLKPNERWPLLIYLHGNNPRMYDFESLLQDSLPNYFKSREQYPFLILVPHILGRKWNPAVMAKLMDTISEQYRVDRDRVYLTGQSMGGGRTWSLATTYPERFAAIAPLCSGGNTNRIERLKSVPTWIFQGELDPLVPLASAQAMADALRNVGGNVKFTILPAAGHMIQTNIYATEDLYRWFLQQNRTNRSE